MQTICQRIPDWWGSDIESTPSLESLWLHQFISEGVSSHISHQIITHIYYIPLDDLRLCCCTFSCEGRRTLTGPASSENPDIGCTTSQLGFSTAPLTHADDRPMTRGGANSVAKTVVAAAEMLLLLVPECHSPAVLVQIGTWLQLSSAMQEWMNELIDSVHKCL